MIVYNSNFSTNSFDAEKKLLKSTWLHASEKMLEEIFKSEMQKILDEIKKYKPLYVLIDTRDFDFKVSQPLQDWIVKYFIERVILIGVSRYAIVVPDIVYSQVSVEKIPPDEEVEEEFLIRYFLDEPKALEWLEC
jgi:hypothetical protein